MELLKLMGLDFVVVPSNIDEYLPKDVSTEDLVMALAQQKARAVAAQYPQDCVIGADTVVELDGTVFGKPHIPEKAKAYLHRLQGREHVVYTGVAVRKGEYEDLQCCSTTVLFAPMSEAEIDWYVATSEPLDKAGAYGVQGLGSIFVEGVKGNYFNVIGMPIPLLYRMLQDAGALHVKRI